MVWSYEFNEGRLRQRARKAIYAAAGPVVRWTWDTYKSMGAIGPNSKAGRAFGSLGEGSIVCFPYDTIMNPQAIHIGSGTMISGHGVLSAGWGPNHPGLSDRVVVIGDRCLIGRGSSIVGHRLIEIGDDVWTGHNVHITDMNHGYEDLDVPISQQSMGELPVHIGSGSWLGHNTVVLPGVTIGRHVVVGAGSIVTGDLPDYSVAVGSPARIVRVHDPDLGWKRPGPEAVTKDFENAAPEGDQVV
ncbi:MAG: acyltransferase [Microthrixaceae bacterium]|nr:acyltransferase [Microthrixaceae bacterium]